MSVLERLNSATPSTSTLIDALLLEQQTAAVDLFSRWHETSDAPSQAKFYRELLPQTKPAAGEQYAFQVDLDACSGCKSCVTACHSLNGLEDEEAWRDVGLLIGSPAGDSALPVLQHVTTACHHCVEPACLLGCPTQAYEKDEATGIVRHLDDQCMGCQYCVLMCPYDVPKYSSTLGIVRKCDLCRQRLADEEAPACVQACPNQAITITLVRHDECGADDRAWQLPGVPNTNITRPTTRYIHQRQSLAELVPADCGHLEPRAAHGPLVFMLVLTQMSVGLLGADLLLWWLSADQLAFAASGMHQGLAVAAAVFGAIGGQCALLHLGRPLVAVRAWLGWRTSWLSREILAFGVYGLLSAMFATVACLPHVAPDWRVPAAGSQLLGLASFASGLVGLFCSVMIYVATRRDCWNRTTTFVKFIGTAIVFGAAAAAMCQPVFSVIAAALLWGKLWFELVSANELARRWFRRTLVSRSVLAVVTGVWLVALAFFVSPSAGSSVFVLLWGLAWAGLLAGELFERLLFFTTAVAPRMPGAMP